MTAALQPAQIVRESLGSQVASHLRDAIVRGELTAGRRLVETELADMLNVSRGPVRDALRILETEGLVAKRGQGVTVLSLDASDIEELYSLREAIESLALGITMGLLEPDLSALRQVMRTMRQAAAAGDADAFTKADAAFHATLCELSGHRRAAAIWQQLEPTAVALLRVTIMQDTDLHQTAEKHQLLLELVAAGDPEPALEELHRHLTGSRDRMLRAWEQSQARS